MGRIRAGPKGSIVMRRGVVKSGVRPTRERGKGIASRWRLVLRPFLLHLLYLGLDHGLGQQGVLFGHFDFACCFGFISCNRGRGRLRHQGLRSRVLK